MELSSNAADGGVRGMGKGGDPTPSCAFNRASCFNCGLTRTLPLVGDVTNREAEGPAADSDGMAFGVAGASPQACLGARDASVRAKQAVKIESGFSSMQSIDKSCTE